MKVVAIREKAYFKININSRPPFIFVAIGSFIMEQLQSTDMKVALKIKLVQWL
jgi:hypothetical protein